jgi:hypothetical protein
MAYDQELADRIRRLIGDAPGLTEKKMFSGLAFLVGGNMAIAASGQGGVGASQRPADLRRLPARPPTASATRPAATSPPWPATGSVP